MLIIGEEDDSEDDYSGKGFERESAVEDMKTQKSNFGFEIESMQNARSYIQVTFCGSI